MLNIHGPTPVTVQPPTAAWIAQHLRAMADQVEREPTYLLHVNVSARVVEVPCPGTCGPVCHVVHRELRPGYRAAAFDLQWDELPTPDSEEA